MNEKVRHQGLSSKEIIFSRDQYSQENLPLNDNDLALKIDENRKKSAIYSAKSKSTFGRPAIPAGAQKGQLVFLKHEGDKTARRELYLVTDVNETNDCVTVCKLKNSMSTESASFRPNHYLYNVKQTEIYLAPNQPIVIEPEIVTFENVTAENPIVHLQKIQNFRTNTRSSKSNATQPDEDLWTFIPSENQPCQDPITDAQENQTSQDDLFNTSLPNPTSTPKEGDLITALDNDAEPPVIFNAKVTHMYKTVQMKNPGWLNIKRSDKEIETSVNLDRTRWRYSSRADVPQIDGNYTLLSDDNSDHSSTNGIFLDDGLSDQDSICGSSHLEHLINSTFIVNKETNPNPTPTPNQDEAAPIKKSLLNLPIEIPKSGKIEYGKVYRIPDDPPFSRPKSVSEADILGAVNNSNKINSKRWTKLKAFISRKKHKKEEEQSKKEG